MTSKLGRKQDLTIDKWEQTTRVIDNIVAPKDLDNRIDETVDRIKATAAGKEVAYGWSGGKDSIALSWLMQQAGINRGVLVVTELEYPSFLEWVDQNQPEGITTINTGQDYRWLKQRPQFLFPTGRSLSNWYRVVQHTGQDRFYRDNKLDMIALGRRTQDGNYTGPKGENIYTNNRGTTRWSPIGDWTHEETIALLAKINAELPPIYRAPRGFQVGTGPWPSRPGDRPAAENWQEVWDTDSRVVALAAEHDIPGAKQFIETKESA